MDRAGFLRRLAGLPLVPVAAAVAAEKVAADDASAAAARYLDRYGRAYGPMTVRFEQLESHGDDWSYERGIEKLAFVTDTDLVVGTFQVVRCNLLYHPNGPATWLVLARADGVNRWARLGVSDATTHLDDEFRVVRGLTKLEVTWGRPLQRWPR